MATTARPHHRASSVASSTSSDKLPPLAPVTPSYVAAAAVASSPIPASATSPSLRDTHTTAATTTTLPGQPQHQQRQQQRHQQQQHQQQQPNSAPPPSVHPSILQPRVAVVLNVPPPWHPWLFALRLCSILPALWWGLPCALELLLRLLPNNGPGRAPRGGGAAARPLAAAGVLDDGDGMGPFALTEGALATIWCFACGYLSFFFTDCLMSRWLINYTPQATIVRLLTINAVNAYLTLSVLSLTGGFHDQRLLLPGWIGIATTLTVCYHITHQKINIRKETSTSVNVFSIASYITMVTLLVHMHSYLVDYPTMPFVARGRQLLNDGWGAWARVKGAIERSEL
ncbi:hypothetical protein JDV02_009988 [Purpureocillium takamizusanense]|uniref:N-glycosylation protein EOS1 n=1 Tax=Purpureocillium takamizusanense TaxID=2060973 RepID=A0A9Q8QRT7_9HYPO|nr:uncharacterized protein JDV02_009988 [Purpureocillium takamizusanense]UNI24222.1 hypothetical protein JDV02_009988 [Purpureocillium takamizusanense]